MSERIPAGWQAERPSIAEARRTITLTDLIRVPLHRLPIVGVMAAVGLLAAAGYLAITPSTATANAVVAVRPVVTDAFTYPGAGADRSVNMNVEAGIASGTGVLRKIAQANGREPKDVRDALSVEVPTGGQILRFSYAGNSVDEAVATVNLAAETYLQVRREMYEDQRAEMLESYDASIVKATEQQAAVQRRLTRSQGGEADAALAQLNSINNQLVELNSARTEIAAVDVSPGWVTQEAQPSLVDEAGGGTLHLALGLVGGALVGLLLTYLRESMDRRVRTAADAREAAGLPLMGTVRRRGFRVKAHAVDADVRYVAMAIAEKFGQQEIPSPVVIIASRAREDTSPMAASLAVALAAEGRTVYVGDDSGRLKKLREVLMTDRRRVPSRPFMQEEARDETVMIPTVMGMSASAARTGSAEADGASRAGAARNDRQQGSARRPSPHPAPVQAGSVQAGSAVSLDRADPDATITFPRIAGGQSTRTAPTLTPSAPVTVAKVTVPTLPSDAVTVGTGVVRTGSYQSAPECDIVLFNAPPAESDERGVREARNGTAIVVVERDRTRLADLRRLVDRLRASGAEPLGFVLTRTGRG
jgi:Mrp family chromosome partitioning ATPase